MSQVRRERRTEQGHVEEGFYNATVVGPNLLSWLHEDEGLYPEGLTFRRVQTWRRGYSVDVLKERYLLEATELCAFFRYICPRLQERRDLRGENEHLRRQLEGERHKASEAARRLREGKEKIYQRATTLDAEKEQLRQQLQSERLTASEARKACADAARESERWKGLHDELYREFEQGLQQNALAVQAWEEVNVKNERLSGANARLQQDLAEAQQGSVKAQQDANEARVEASSLHEKLRETDAAFTEAKKKFISAPDLVPCLQSLAAEVKTLQETVRTNGERTAELMTTRPAEGRRTVKTLHQMKRVLHDIGRFPRRRRARATDAADDGGGAIKRGRICYVCRCKGHLAKDCPQARVNAVESVDPTISDAQQRAGEPNTEASSSSGWTIFSALRRFTSGID